MNKKIISFFEIYLIVLFSVSFAYMVGKTNDLGASHFSEQESKFISKFRELVLGSLSKGLVSAQSPALWTCQTNVNGTACQEYPSTTCNSVCATSCFPGTRNNFAACNLGSCFDPVVGTCSAGVPQFLCQQQGGQWSAQQQSQCNRECCLINPNGNGGAAQSQFTTEQQCNYLGSTLGETVSFVPVQGEVECLLKASTQVRGACVLEFLPEIQKYNCETTTQTACITSGGDFYEGQLCTNPALNTKCETSQNTKCFDGLDGVYYIDSCNNRANIYDSTKLNDISYWTNIVPETQSCLVGATGTSIANEDRCGNCNYLLGSICGTPRNGIDTPPIYGNYVCRDLSCVDEWGNARQNGESWCAFDGRIGLDGSPAPVPTTNSLFASLPVGPGQTWCIANGIATIYNPPTALNPNITITTQPVNLPNNPFTTGTICSNDTTISTINPRGTNEERSIDLPGSRHYRKICFDGEVRTEPCGEGRSEICAQNVQPTTGYTSASCRINTWQQCFAANDNPESLNKCEENPDCFLKHVEIDSFKFDICSPQYPPGLYTSEDTSNDDEVICSYASQECTYIEKKKLTGWKCIINCGCKTREFTETMNNLCTSLGDCGGKINLNGDFTHDGYSVRGRAPRLGTGYIAGMQSYVTPVQGQSATVLNNSQLAAIFGVPESNFDPSSIHSTFAFLGAGAAGLLHAGAIASALGLGGEVAATTVATGAVGGTGAGTTAGAGVGGAGAGSFATAVGAAAVGGAIGYILGTVFGLEGTSLTILMVAGAAIGLAAGIGSALGSEFLTSIAGFLTNPITIIVVIVIIVIMMVLGIGKTRERQVEFKCLPWQPPSGGAKCDLCNSDDLPCTKYKCETFGKTCRYLNEGTGNEACVNIAPNDASPPTIDVNNDALSSGFSYNNPQTNIGVTIKNASVNDGCLQEYSHVNWGVVLNEPGQCKVSEVHTGSYDEMEDYFSSINGNNFVTNHTTSVAMPTLDDLGVTGIDPARRGNYRLYVRCEDASGNSNVAEYIAEFCVSPANDLTPPVLSNFNPSSPGLVGLGTTTKDVQFYTNEPATCRWSLTSGQDYSQMTGQVNCNNELNQVALNGWLCQVNLPVQNATTTDYYFRCADQPWIGNNETNPNIPDEGRNVNSEDTVYQIRRTTDALGINYISPNATTLFIGSVPLNVNLEIHTTGGINNGNAFCSFSYGGTAFTPFFITSTNVHTQQNLQLFPGQYDIGLQCIDSAQNIALANAQFSIELDSQGPVITRVYSSGSSLTVITNEPSTCAWSSASCSFDFASGVLLSGSGKLHTMSYENGITYRIKCKDTFGNVGTCLTASGGY